MALRTRLVLAAILSLVLTAQATAAPLKDVTGGKDHPMVSRYADSILTGYKQDKFDETELVLGPATFKDGVRGFQKTQLVQGQRTRLLYVAPRDRSSLEVMRNYQDALARAGFSTLFTCARTECGTKMADTMYAAYNNPRKILGKQLSEYAFSMDVEDERVTTARLVRPSGDVYVSVLTARQGNAASDEASGRVAAFIEVVETKPMEGNMVTVNADAMQKGLSAEGKIALYGIYFDTDKVDLRAESKAQLEEMAKLLKANARLNVFIVGHTDNQGKLDYNLSLSQRRAEAVSRALSGQYGIDARRLIAKGVANLAPLASNAAEAGRAKNRRVELVEQ